METFEIIIDQTSKEFKDNLKKYYRYYLNHDKFKLTIRLLNIFMIIFVETFGIYYLFSNSFSIEIIVLLFIAILAIIYQHFAYLNFYRRNYPKKPAKNLKIVFDAESFICKDNINSTFYKFNDFAKIVDTPYAFIFYYSKNSKQKHLLILKYSFDSAQIIGLKKLWNLDINSQKPNSK